MRHGSPALLLLLLCLEGSLPAEAQGDDGRLHVRVVDWQGTPVPDAEVAVDFDRLEDSMADKVEGWGRWHPTDLRGKTDQAGAYSLPMPADSWMGWGGKAEREVSASIKILVLTDTLYGHSDCFYQMATVPRELTVTVVCVVRRDLAGILHGADDVALRNVEFSYVLRDRVRGQRTAEFHLRDGRTDADGRFRIPAWSEEAEVEFLCDFAGGGPGNYWEEFRFRAPAKVLTFGREEFTRVYANLPDSSAESTQRTLSYREAVESQRDEDSPWEEAFTFGADGKRIDKHNGPLHRQLKNLKRDPVGRIVLLPGAKKLLILKKGTLPGRRMNKVGHYSWFDVPEDLSRTHEVKYLPVEAAPSCKIRVHAPVEAVVERPIRVLLRIFAPEFWYDSWYEASDGDELSVHLIPGADAYRIEAICGKAGTNLDSEDCPALPEVRAGGTYELQFRKTVSTTVRCVDGRDASIAGFELGYRYRNDELSRSASKVRVCTPDGAEEHFRPGEEVDFYYLGRSIPAVTPREYGQELLIRLGAGK